MAGRGRHRAQRPNQHQLEITARLALGGKQRIGKHLPTDNLEAARLINHASGTFTSPKAVLALLLIARNFILLAIWVVPSRVVESIQRYSPVGSSTLRINANVIRACSRVAAPSTYSMLG